MWVRNEEIASLKCQFLSYAPALFGSRRERHVVIKQSLSCRRRSVPAAPADNLRLRELMALLTQLTFM